MTWKRCAGCTRAIASTAFTCEYCGQECENHLDLLPDEQEARPDAAHPLVASGQAPRVDEPLLGTTSAGHSIDPPPSHDEDDLSLPALFHSENHDATHKQGEDAPGNYGLELFPPQPDAQDAPPPALPIDKPHVTPRVAARAEPPPPAAGGARTRKLAMVGGGVVAAGALMFTFLGMRGSASPEPAAASAPTRRALASAPARTKPAVPAAARPEPDAPRWNRVMDGRWVGTSHKTAAFEVQATGRVHVWTRDVTPVLVVRCDAGRMEAFVYTQSAARMEPQDGDHTVNVTFDGGSAVTQRWPDSAEHDALFARDGAQFTRQLTEARTLRFGFTPHNAQPAVATFALDGLSELLSAAPRQCGLEPHRNR
jgi:hypothetical protein